MTDTGITAADLDDLVALVEEAAKAYIRGDARRYFALIQHADDHTLMAPLGGDTRHGVDRSEERLAEIERMFRGGDATLEVEQTYASGDLAVIVAVERQHGVVYDLPDQDLSLRVTLVFRRRASGWEQVHRHADALVHPIPFDRVAELARGA